MEFVRIDFGGEKTAQWCEETGNGSSTYDICTRCHSKHKDTPAGELVSEFASGVNIDNPYNGDPFEPEVKMELTYSEPEVERHDPYECDMCGTKIWNV